MYVCNLKKLNIGGYLDYPPIISRPRVLDLKAPDRPTNARTATENTDRNWTLNTLRARFRKSRSHTRPGICSGTPMEIARYALSSLGPF